MSTHAVSAKRKTVHDIRAAKGGTPLVCLTAYTVPIARAADRCADLILVGDSVGMVLYGMDSTLPVSLDMMVAHGRAVVAATQRALVTVDMPFGSYQETPVQAFANAAWVMKETGAAAVKLEGGTEMADTVHFLTRRGVPVLGHIGLQPQSVHEVGGYRVAGRAEDERHAILADARALEAAGAFGIVLECVEAALADAVTRSVEIPVIGIGASVACDGQILVTEDLAGLTIGPAPKFVKRYVDGAAVLDGAVDAFAADVRARAFPDADHSYGAPPAGRRVRLLH